MHRKPLLLKKKKFTSYSYDKKKKENIQPPIKFSPKITYRPALKRQLANNFVPGGQQAPVNNRNHVLDKSPRHFTTFDRPQKTKSNPKTNKKEVKTVTVQSGHKKTRSCNFGNNFETYDARKIKLHKPNRL